jgi:hypothetical protein
MNFVKVLINSKIWNLIEVSLFKALYNLSRRESTTKFLQIIDFLIDTLHCGVSGPWNLSLHQNVVFMTMAIGDYCPNVIM